MQLMLSQLGKIGPSRQSGLHGERDAADQSVRVGGASRSEG